MISALADAVRAELRTRKYPYPVSYGPERTQRDGFAAGIVFARDREKGDEIAPPPVARGALSVDARSPFVRRVSGAVTVFARSPRPNATAGEHEDECDRVCDAVLCAMYRVLKGRGLPLLVTESRLLQAAEFNGLEQWPGCAAQIRFNVTTLVRDVNYLGVGPLTGEVASTLAPIVTSDDLPSYDPIDR